jgi:hypothetical protein
MEKLTSSRIKASKNLFIKFLKLKEIGALIPLLVLIIGGSFVNKSF